MAQSLPPTRQGGVSAAGRAGRSRRRGQSVCHRRHQPTRPARPIPAQARKVSLDPPAPSENGERLHVLLCAGSTSWSTSGSTRTRAPSCKSSGPSSEGKSHGAPNARPTPSDRLALSFQLDASVDPRRVLERCPAYTSGADLYALCSDAMAAAVKRKIAAIQRGRSSGRRRRSRRAVTPSQPCLFFVQVWNPRTRRCASPWRTLARR